MEEEEKKKEPILAAGVTCFPGRRRNLLPRWVFDPALYNAVVPDLGSPTVCTGSRGAGQCLTVFPPHEVALSNQECEAVPSSNKALHLSKQLVTAPMSTGTAPN